ncbi:MAG: glycosyltransferase family 4 protein [Gemmatimonadaceae bacterium]
MKRLGIHLSAGPGGGVLQYSQAILTAAMSLPGDFELVAAFSDDTWRSHLTDRVKVVKLGDSTLNRALNRLWHESGLPISLWRKSAAKVDSNVRALVGAKCDLWVCPNHERYVFRAPIPALGTVHDLMHRYERRFPEVSAGGEYEAREFHFRETVKWAKGILVDSELGKRQLMESYGIDASRVFVLPYIAPQWIYDYDGRDDAAVAAKYSLPAKYFFYPAQFYRHKNHSNLISAVARLRSTHPDVRLVLVGATERNAWDEVRRQVDELDLSGNVLFPGYVEDREMAAFYRRARALVMPTYFGPTNIPQLEAFALGCPVATSRIYGIPDQVGDAAMLFDPGSVDEIYTCMTRLWTDDSLCAALAARGREYAARWGPAQFGERFHEIVGKLT